MGWHQFRYIFNREVENAMRYSIHEALRRQCRSVAGGTTDGITEDAVETFKRKMERHTGRPLALAEGTEHEKQTRDSGGVG
jgi:hypothetical protein